MSYQIENIDKDRNKKEPNRNSGIKSTLTEMKNSLEGLKSDMSWQQKESLNLKRDHMKLSFLRNRKNKEEK